MSYFLTETKLNIGDMVELSGEEVKHVLLARRMKKGEEFNLQDPEENRYRVEIKSIDRNKLTVEIKDQLEVPHEPGAKITLFQSYVNEKALDFILQKSTELCANKIVLFNSQNTAVKLTREIFEKKQERWNKILWEAAKQSDRVRPPQLEFLESLEKVISRLEGNAFLLDPSGKPFKNLVQSFKSCSIVIGPEGGFTETEVSEFRTESNITFVSLGPILLRAETAALASLAILRNLSS